MSDVARHTEFEAVVRRVGPSMLAYARRRVDPDTADDVVAEALLVLWRRRLEQGRSRSQSTGEAEDKEIAWAIGITRGCLANTRRSARRHIALVGRLAGHERPPPAPDVSSTEIDEDLRAVLGSLREDDQELLRLWAWDDLKPAQIATIVGTSPEAVSVRLHRAKKRLAAALAVSHAPREIKASPSTRAPNDSRSP